MSATDELEVVVIDDRAGFYMVPTVAIAKARARLSGAHLTEALAGLVCLARASFAQHGASREEHQALEANLDELATGDPRRVARAGAADRRQPRRRRRRQQGRAPPRRHAPAADPDRVLRPRAFLRLRLRARVPGAAHAFAQRRAAARAAGAVRDARRTRRRAATRVPRRATGASPAPPSPNSRSSAACRSARSSERSHCSSTPGSSASNRSPRMR